MAKQITLGNMQRYLAQLDQRFLIKDGSALPTTVIGSKTDTSGYSFQIPWLEVNDDGVVVLGGTHTHTIPQLFDMDASGNITLHQSS